MSQSPIYTIGYGARDGDAFITILQEYKIDYLIDIRSKPYSSYKPEFSKRPLDQALTANNIRYVFMGDSLGGNPTTHRATMTTEKLIMRSAKTGPSI